MKKNRRLFIILLGFLVAYMAGCARQSTVDTVSDSQAIATATPTATPLPSPTPRVRTEDDDARDYANIRATRLHEGGNFKNCYANSDYSFGGGTIKFTCYCQDTTASTDEAALTHMDVHDKPHVEAWPPSK